MALNVIHLEKSELVFFSSPGKIANQMFTPKSSSDF